MRCDDYEYPMYISIRFLRFKHTLSIPIDSTVLVYYPHYSREYAYLPRVTSERFLLIPGSDDVNKMTLHGHNTT